MPVVDKEIWQACNLRGEFTEGITKDQAAKGSLHAAAHLWLYRKSAARIEVLLQKRAIDKRTWPGLYDISAAGHIDYGETPVRTAVRELYEELGLKLMPEELTLLFVSRQYDPVPNTDIIENEFVWVYGVMLDADFTPELNDGEVDSTKWLELSEFEALTKQKDKLVPHGHAYFTHLLNEIKCSTNEDH